MNLFLDVDEAGIKIMNGEEDRSQEEYESNSHQDEASHGNKHVLLIRSIVQSN